MEFQQELRMMRKTADGSSWEEIIGAKTGSRSEGKNFEIEELEILSSKLDNLKLDRHPTGWLVQFKRRSRMRPVSVEERKANPTHNSLKKGVLWEATTVEIMVLDARI